MFIISCRTTDLSKKQQIKQFKKMEWISGKWQNKGIDMTIIEEWSMINDTLFEAYSIMIFDNDTLFNENIKLCPFRANIYYYSVSINAEESQFKSSYILIKNTGKKIVFEDKSNIEQSKITYTKKSEDIIGLQIDGLRNGETNTENYYLKRVK